MKKKHKKLKILSLFLSVSISICFNTMAMNNKQEKQNKILNKNIESDEDTNIDNVIKKIKNIEKSLEEKKNKYENKKNNLKEDIIRDLIPEKEIYKEKLVLLEKYEKILNEKYKKIINEELDEIIKEECEKNLNKKYQKNLNKENLKNSHKIDTAKELIENLKNKILKEFKDIEEKIDDIRKIIFYINEILVNTTKIQQEIQKKQNEYKNRKNLTDAEQMNFIESFIKFCEEKLKLITEIYPKYLEEAEEKLVKKNLKESVRIKESKLLIKNVAYEILKELNFLENAINLKNITDISNKIKNIETIFRNEQQKFKNKLTRINQTQIKFKK